MWPIRGRGAEKAVSDENKEYFIIIYQPKSPTAEDGPLFLKSPLEPICTIWNYGTYLSSSHWSRIFLQPKTSEELDYLSMISLSYTSIIIFREFWIYFKDINLLKVCNRFHCSLNSLYVFYLALARKKGFVLLTNINILAIAYRKKTSQPSLHITIT